VSWLKTWIERELLERAVQIGAGEVVDGPSSPLSFLKQLPLREWGFENCPAIPYWADQYGDPDIKHILATLSKLNGRGQEVLKTADPGLSIQYTIDGQTKAAYEFLYDLPLPPAQPPEHPQAVPTPPNRLALDKPEDFTLSWTTYKDVYTDSQNMVAAFAKTLTSTRTATASFWPTISTFGLPYNLLVLAKVDAKRAAVLKAELGAAWTDEDMGALQAKGLLYEIDMSILASVKSTRGLDDAVRFTPGTVTVLKQDPQTKALTPIAIRVWTDGGQSRVYTGDDNAWLWALQAAKTSITVWGIWLGHVYHWHIVTAAMQMTMYNRLPADHRLFPLLTPQSQSLIDFDYMLLSLLWGQISPPTPLDGYMSLLRLLDKFAESRTFFEDDPLNELTKRGLDMKDFTVVTDWDAYPVVGFLLDIWDITGEYVTAVVEDLYASDADVANDNGLKAWMSASADPNEGNVQGLPDPIGTRAELAKVLTSILYRVTVHGAGSINPAVNPVLSFVSNFPPCLQSDDIPEPGDPVTTEWLLERLPHTGTIGGMTTFYFTFVYSKPYAPLIPKGGAASDPYFPKTQPNCNKALVAYRTAIGQFVSDYTTAWNQALARIRGGAPGSVPGYAKDQAEQWPLSIEI
jgi:Lipoxygenase